MEFGLKRKRWITKLMVLGDIDIIINEMKEYKKRKKKLKSQLIAMSISNKKFRSLMRFSFFHILRKIDGCINILAKEVTNNH